MIGHLNEEQISVIAAGEKDAASMAHLRSCADCRQQIENLQDVLGAFRGAVREMSELRPAVAFARQSRMGTGAVLRACAAVFVILLGVFAHRLSTNPVRHPDASSSSASVASDALLLDHVRDDVVRSTPPGMEGLLGFVSAGTTSR